MNTVLEELRKKRCDMYKTNSTVAGKKSSSLSVITLNVNGLNSPIKTDIGKMNFFLFFWQMNLKKTWSNYMLSRGYWQWVDEQTHWKWLMLGKIEGNRRTELPRTRWLESITHSMDMNLSKLWETVEDRGARPAASMEPQRVGNDLVTEQQQQQSWSFIEHKL